jgi:hypothetical protein
VISWFQDLLSKATCTDATCRLLFQEAERRQPSIIFFDEIDGLAPARGGGGGGDTHGRLATHSRVSDCVCGAVRLVQLVSRRGGATAMCSDEELPQSAPHFFYHIILPVVN